MAYKSQKCVSHCSGDWISDITVLGSGESLLPGWRLMTCWIFTWWRAERWSRFSHDFQGANGIMILCNATATATAKSLQSCPTLCDPIDSSPPGSPVPGILQARTLEWVAISFSNAWKWNVKVKSLSRVRLWATPWTAAYQAPPSIGFSRQEYWSGVPLPSLYVTLILSQRPHLLIS